MAYSSLKPDLAWVNVYVHFKLSRLAEDPRVPQAYLNSIVDHEGFTESAGGEDFLILWENLSEIYQELSMEEVVANTSSYSWMLRLC